jgi:Choline/Carnitine o-acyltransferase
MDYHPPDHLNDLFECQTQKQVHIAKLFKPRASDAQAGTDIVVDESTGLGNKCNRRMKQTAFQVQIACLSSASPRQDNQRMRTLDLTQLLFLNSRRFTSRASPMPRLSNWKSLAPFPPLGTPTFQHQPDLPQLPVPSLASTLKNLKESLKPLAHSPEEYRSMVAKIDEFGKPGGLGESLQRRLEQRRSGRDQWLEEWWDDAAYLNYRDSVSLLSSTLSAALLKKSNRSLSMYPTSTGFPHCHPESLVLLQHLHLT